MIRALTVLGLLFATADPQSMPASLRGQWRIVKILPTTGNVACWEEDRAKTLLNTFLVYSPGRMVWRGGSAEISEAITRTLSPRKFKDEYKVDLVELGIHAPSVTEIDLQHEDADITGATTEVPGDTIVLAGPNRIVVSACGVFYSAVRAGGSH